MSRTMQEARDLLFRKFNKQLYLNKKQTAEALNIAVVTLDNYRGQGKIKGMARPQKIYFYIDEVARFMCGE